MPPFTDREKAFVYVIYGCGLRQGKALALTVSDLDFEKNVLTVNKALAYGKDDKPYIKTTKSSNGIRKVPLPAQTRDFLRSYCSGVKGKYLFYSKGSELMTREAYRRMWDYIAKKMNSPKLTAHIFRRNYCANLCYQVPRISLKKVAELLGDTDKMVIEVYNHVIEEKDDALGAIEDALK
ncbi:MAG: site-specific integrase [Lachnospiraceae bacterium]|nr:site-specific integrase [Lachnospiraceae bacterium]